MAENFPTTGASRLGTAGGAAVSRYLTVGALALAIMLAAYLAAFSWNAWSQQKAGTFDYLRTTAEVEARTLNAFFEHHEQSLKQLRDRLFDIDGRLIDTAGAQDALHQAMADEPDWRMAYIADLDGKIALASAASIAGRFNGLSLSTRPGWAGSVNELRHGALMSIGRDLENPVTHEWVLPLRFGVRDREGNLTHILAAAIPLDRPLAFWQDRKLPPEAAVGILRVDDAVYLVARNPLPPSTTAADAYGTTRTADFGQLLLAGKLPLVGTYEGAAGLTGEPMLWGHARLSSYPVVFFIQSPRTLLWQRWWASVWLTYLIFGALLIGGYIIYRWIVARQLAFCRDMGAAEERLRASKWDLQRNREQLVLAQKIARIGSFEHDIATGRVEWSDEMYEILGVDKATAEPGPQLLLKVVHPDDRARLSRYRSSEIDSKPGANVIPSIEYRIIRPDGAERIVHRERYVVYDDAGRLVRRVGTLQDITERKKIEIELQHRTEALTRAQRLAAVGSIEYDIVADTYECSEQTFRIFGIEKRNAPTTFDGWLQYIHPDDRALVRRNRSREFDGQSAAAIEFRIIRPDGIERIIRRETDIVRDEAGRALRRCGTLQDVTDLRLAERRKLELERQLMHSQKLEALGTLAGGIAHDLNNILVPILALSKITARQLQPGSEARENLETILGASEHARDLVKQVLAFSRRDATDMREIRIGQVVIEALKLLRSTISSSIQIDTEITDTAPIHADASGIQQIVTNLVTNAAGAIGEGAGKITVGLAMTGSPSHKQELCLSVADTGSGMDETTRARIFEPFFTTKQVGEGTGLGLSIVHGIVATHRGRIEVESEPGKGTRFSIYFPAAETAAEAAA